VDDALRQSFEVDPWRSVAILTSQASGRQLVHYQTQLRLLPDVVSVTPAAHIAGALDTIEVAPATSTLSSASQQLVSHIRALRPPFSAGVTGAAAALLDLKSSITERLPLAIGLVILATTIALFLLTGSAILPFKTLIMNALTIGAAYGIMVLVFQDGNLQGPLGYEPPGAIDITQPVVMLAVVFGLSTDYGVFLLDRIREAHQAGLENRQAVALGLERTGRIVTTAAILFCVAVGSTVVSPLVEVKEVSLGIVAAILLDATIVRSMLVPALMRLLGDWNWWAPRPLRRLHSVTAGHAVQETSAVGSSTPR
jgi:RND superfamily putative drug exporter